MNGVETQQETEPIQTTYRIADAHAHIYPSKIADKATAAVGDFYDIGMAVESGMSDVLLKLGEPVGCERYLVCSVATKLEQEESIARFISEQCARHPEFIGLGAYHQDETDPARLLDLYDELGLRGVKIHPDFQKVNIDDPRLMPLYAECEKRHEYVLFHIGDNRYDFSSPDRLSKILEKYPNLFCQAAHFGGYRRWDDCYRFKSTSVYYDTSSALAFISPLRAQELVDILGVDHIMWGVDFPMWNHTDEYHRFMGLGLSQADNRAIFYDNFARVFGIDEKEESCER